MKRNAKKPSKRRLNGLPKGWTAERIQAVIDHYENQTDEDAIAEAEAAYNAVTTTMMQIPIQLVSKVEQLLSKAG